MMVGATDSSTAPNASAADFAAADAALALAARQAEAEAAVAALESALDAGTAPEDSAVAGVFGIGLDDGDDGDDVEGRGGGSCRGIGEEGKGEAEAGHGSRHGGEGEGEGEGGPSGRTSGSLALAAWLDLRRAWLQRRLGVRRGLAAAASNSNTGEVPLRVELAALAEAQAQWRQELVDQLLAGGLPGWLEAQLVAAAAASGGGDGRITGTAEQAAAFCGGMAWDTARLQWLRGAGV